MIAGIGVDIVEHERIERIYERYQDRFAEKILSDEEMDDYRESPYPVRLLAKRFAAKEAATKALGTGMAQGVTFAMIAVKHDLHGKPLLTLSSKAAEIADKMGVESNWLSISDEQHHSVAMVVLEKAG
jgi:holo-[acyl-carrier protein] synthase